MVANHIFHELVFRAHLLRKKASWGYWILVFDSSDGPAAQPVISDSGSPAGSRTEFEVRRTTSCEEDAGATMNAPMDHESSLGYFFVLGEIWVIFHLCCISGPAEVPVPKFIEGEISTEAESKRREKSGSARITRCLMPLARGTSAPSDFPNRESSRTFLEQVFDNGMYRLKGGYFLWRSMVNPQFRCFYFRPLVCRSCYYPHHCDRSPVGHTSPFQLCWGAITESWPNSEKLLLLVSSLYFISFPRIVL